MAQEHLFIFSPGEWIGHGKVSFTGSSQELKFITKWVISEPQGGIIYAEQHVEKQELEEPLLNRFRFSTIKNNHFTVSLENEILGKVIYGQGKIDEDSIIWAFEAVGEVTEVGLAGVEMYTVQTANDYLLHAEYYLDEDHKSIIEGHIWRKQ